MRLRHLIFVSLVATSAVGTLAAQSPVVGVASVFDGDTLEIHGQRIRLHGIDAPESGQSCEKDGRQYRCDQQTALVLADKIGRAPKLLEKQGSAPCRIVTDKMKSYPVAFREIGLTAVHDRGLRANNRAENSHRPVRRRERKQQKSKSSGSAQRFLPIQSAVKNTFYAQRHLLNRKSFKTFRADALQVWNAASGAA